MPESNSRTPPAAKHSLEDIMTQALLAYFAETPVHPALVPATDARSPLRRLLLIAHPGLASDCLCGTLRENGYDVAMYSLYDAVKPDGADADLVILSMSHYQEAALAVVRQRVDDIRRLSLGLPIMAIIENAERAAIRDLATSGLAALVVGPLSAKIALAIVHLVLLGGSQVAAEIYLNSNCGVAWEVRKPSPEGDHTRKCAQVHGSLLESFTSREVALLARLREGMQNKVIAHELGIAESTVKVHLRNIMTKLHASNRTQVASMLAGSELFPDHALRLAGNLDGVSDRSDTGHPVR
jgi:DNA-binding NarL/FixJ family response regulator